MSEEIEALKGVIHNISNIMKCTTQTPDFFNTIEKLCQQIKTNLQKAKDFDLNYIFECYSVIESVLKRIGKECQLTNYGCKKYNDIVHVFELYKEDLILKIAIEDHKKYTNLIFVFENVNF